MLIIPTIIASRTQVMDEGATLGAILVAVADEDAWSGHGVDPLHTRLNDRIFTRSLVLSHRGACEHKGIQMGMHT